MSRLDLKKKSEDHFWKIDNFKDKMASKVNFTETIKNLSLDMKEGFKEIHQNLNSIESRIQNLETTRSSTNLGKRSLEAIPSMDQSIKSLENLLKQNQFNELNKNVAEYYKLPLTNSQKMILRYYEAAYLCHIGDFDKADECINEILQNKNILPIDIFAKVILLQSKLLNRSNCYEELVQKIEPTIEMWRPITSINGGQTVYGEARQRKVESEEINLLFNTLIPIEIRAELLHEFCVSLVELECFEDVLGYVKKLFPQMVSMNEPLLKKGLVATAIQAAHVQKDLAYLHQLEAYLDIFQIDDIDILGMLHYKQALLYCEKNELNEAAKIAKKGLHLGDWGVSTKYYWDLEQIYEKASQSGALPQSMDASL